MTREESVRALAQKYDAIAYAAQANAQSHPTHLATVATLLGLTPPDVTKARVLEVGCSDGSNLLPMAWSLPHAQFVGCDISPHAIGEARRGARELGLGNVDFVERDLAMLVSGAEAFDYIIAHGVYSWVPASVRDALLALARARLARNGVLFVSFNVYPGCHVREAAWRTLHHHVGGIADPRARLDAARAFAALVAEPQATQTETDAFLRQEFGRIATLPDSALFHDDLAVPNQPVYFHEFAAHVARHGLTFLAEAKLSMMTPAGLAPRMQQLVGGMDRLAREQYLDFARLRRFRQSLVCRTDATASNVAPAERARRMHAAASMTLVRSAAEGTAFVDVAGDANARAARLLLEWLVRAAPRIVTVEQATAWLAREFPRDAAAARPVAALLADACYAGSVDLYTQAPPLAFAAGERPEASPVVRWQARRRSGLTNIRHEPVRLDDPHARSLLPLLDGTRTRADLALALQTALPEADRENAAHHVDAYLSQFALHGLLVA